MRRSALSWSLRASSRAGGLGDALLGDGGPQAVEDVGGGAHAHVGPDERLLQVVPRLRVDPALGQDRPDVAGHRAAGPPEALAEGGLRANRLRLRLRLRFGNGPWLGCRDGFGLRHRLGLGDRLGLRGWLGERDRRGGRLERGARAPTPGDEQDPPTEEEHDDEEDDQQFHGVSQRRGWSE